MMVNATCEMVVVGAGMVVVVVVVVVVESPVCRAK